MAHLERDGKIVAVILGEIVLDDGVVADDEVVEAGGLLEDNEVLETGELLEDSDIVEDSEDTEHSVPAHDAVCFVAVSVSPDSAGDTTTLVEDGTRREVRVVGDDVEEAWSHRVKLYLESTSATHGP